MTELQREPRFNPEAYRGHTVDIVHIQSVRRVLSGRKPAEPETKNKAQIVARNIQALKEAKIPLREIDNPSLFVPPPNHSSSPIIVGGAFIGQCIADYEESATRAGYILKVDPLLSVELD